jgi:hypothetical protein
MAENCSEPHNFLRRETMLLKGFDKAYYLQAKLTALQTTLPEWAGKTITDLETVLTNQDFTAESHYQLYGYQEGLAPNALFNAEEYTLAKANSMFNAGGYSTISAARAAFVAAWPGDVYNHYLQYGSLEGINPSNAFDESSYYDSKLADLQANSATSAEWATKDVDDLKAVFGAQGFTALHHYIAYGADEGIAVTQVPASEAVIIETTETEETSIAGLTFQLTTNNDSFTGDEGNDHFYGIYDGNTFSAQNTFNDGDILDGAGGIDTLHIDHFQDVAITPPDTLWTGISGIEKIVMNTTGSGAQTITTGTNFNTAFASGGVDLSTTTTGDGAITLNMASFTGTAKLTANSVAGAIDISGVNFTQIDVTTTGAGAQTVTTTGTVDTIVNATSSEGATSITTGAGDDTITLYATAADGDNTITAGKGADTINLYTNFASIDTIVQADGDSMASTANTTTDNIAAGQTITFGNGLDIINNFGVEDRLDVGTDGAAVSGIGMNEASFTATKTIFFSGTYDGNIFTIAADGGGTDTLLLDTTAADDTDIATADTWILLQGVTSGALSAGTFI